MTSQPPGAPSATSHRSFVADTYGPRAADYVQSAVHAQGEDLDWIAARLRAAGAESVLDLGCGGGHVAYRAAQSARSVVACDLAPEMLSAVAASARERGIHNITTQAGVAESLPLKDGAFDAVVSRFSAHHWRHLEQGLREARRVLVPGGLAIFVDTVAPADALHDTHLQTIELLRDATHVRNYGVPHWLGALERAGLHPQSVSTRRLRLDFASWIARTRTPPLMVDAIRAVWRGASADVRAALCMEEDGSFQIEIMVVDAQVM